MVTAREVDESRRGLAAGMRGPVLIKWCEQLLADRDERIARECDHQPRRSWPFEVPPGPNGQHFNPPLT